MTAPGGSADPWDQILAPAVAQPRAAVVLMPAAPWLAQLHLLLVQLWHSVAIWVPPPSVEAQAVQLQQALVAVQLLLPAGEC